MALKPITKASAKTKTSTKASTKVKPAPEPAPEPEAPMEEVGVTNANGEALAAVETEEQAQERLTG